jgi:FHA domain-containing protein
MPLPFLPLSASAALNAASASIEQAFTLIQGAYMRAPTLVLALTALLVLPAVALISVATRAVRGYRSRRAARRAADEDGMAGDMPDTARLPMRSQAWVTVDGAGTVALAGQVARIGRHRDNDIRLSDRSVHRRHAVIKRTPDEAFLILDISGSHGSGVRVNGQRTERVQLADGDVIELGRVRLKFETIRPESLPMESRRPVGIEG